MKSTAAAVGPRDSRQCTANRSVLCGRSTYTVCSGVLVAKAAANPNSTSGSIVDLERMTGQRRYSVGFARGFDAYRSVSRSSAHDLSNHPHPIPADDLDDLFLFVAALDQARGDGQPLV